MGKEEALRRIKEAAETGATELDFTRQDLTELPHELFLLKNLTKLDISGNLITELPQELFQLTNLCNLDISFNNLNELPKQIFQMQSLTALGLGGLRLESLSIELFQLTSLTWLDLRNNHLAKLPQEIVQLINLRELYIGSNCFTEIPQQVFKLKNLAYFGISMSQLSSLPPGIFQLANLKGLYISHNQLTELSSEIIQLSKLKSLNLNRNHLTSLPPEIVQLTNLKRLSLDDNPLTSPPIELAEQGISAIREYFAKLEEGSRILSEVKIVLVGEGASGKTSLTRCLRGEQFDEHEPTTHGIRIKQWQIDSAGQPVRCNLWDFGGQEIMHATHQFFLSRRSLYVLVLDGRRDERPEYWLKYIESIGGGSPVLVVLNKYDTNPSFDLNRPFLQQKYPFIVGFYRTSCHNGHGVEAFKQAVCETLGNIRLTKNRWPECWFRVKERLEQENEPRITYEEFEDICTQEGVDSESSQAVLADFLHDLGSVIRFQGFGLDGNNVLDPKWVTGAVYKIINAETVAAGNGVLRLDDLTALLRWKEGDEHRYKRNDHPYFIELMKKFELCYKLDDEQVLIPQLLAVPEPSFPFDERGALRFCVDYGEFLPASIMPRFIVKRHHEIKDKLRWRTGVVLENPLLEAAAVIRADVEARRIHIVVTGTQPKAFLTVILLTLREINSGFEGLTVSERIPMPDDPRRSVDCEHLYTLLELGQKTYTPEGSRTVYKVEELLSIVDEERILKLLQEIRGEAGDKESFLDVVGKNLKAEPELFGFGINLKAVGEAAWQRYKAWRGENGGG